MRSYYNAFLQAVGACLGHRWSMGHQRHAHVHEAKANMAPETLQGLPLFAQEMQKVLLHLHTLFTCFHVKATQGHPLLLIHMPPKAASEMHRLQTA